MCGIRNLKCSSRANNISETLASCGFSIFDPACSFRVASRRACAQPKPQLHGHFLGVHAAWLHSRTYARAGLRTCAATDTAGASAASRSVPDRWLHPYYAWCACATTGTAACIIRRTRSFLDFRGACELTAAAAFHVKFANQPRCNTSTRGSCYGCT